MIADFFKQGTFWNDADSPEAVERKRKLIESLIPRYGSARYVGEGLGHLATGIVAGRRNRQLDKAEGEGRQSAEQVFNAAVRRGSDYTPGGFSILGPDTSVETQPLQSPAQGIAADTMSALGKGPGGVDFGAVEAAYGLPSGYLQRTGQIESGLNPNAANPNSSAEGLFQFIDSTAQQYGLQDKRDPVASTDAAARLARDNAAVLTRALGRQPNAAELYLAHQQGGGGAAKLLANPNARAVDIVGEQAVRLNGGNANMTAGEFANQWLSKFDGGATSGRVAGGPERVVQAGGADLSALYEALGNPWLSDSQRAVLTQMIDQEQQNADPLRALQLERAQLENAQLRNPQPSPTDDMREYEFAKSQGYPGSFTDFMTDLRKAGSSSTNVNVSTGADSSELRKQLSGKEGELWGTYLEQGNTSAGVAQDMQLLDELITLAPQGPITGRAAQMFPGVSSAADAFQSVVKRVAPTLRAPGSGSTSDVEYDGMLKSLPQLSSKPEANAAIAGMMKAKSAINIERANIVRQFQNGEIAEQDARRAIQEIDQRSIMTPELAAVFSGLAPEQSGGDAPEGVPPDVWGVMTPEERALWQN